MPQANSVQRQIRLVRQSVAALERALRRLGPMLRETPAGAAPARRRLKLSPKRRAQLKLHGSYLGHVRQLKPRQKAQVKALKAQKGYHAAIALARRLGRG